MQHPHGVRENELRVEFSETVLRKRRAVLGSRYLGSYSVTRYQVEKRESQRWISVLPANSLSGVFVVAKSGIFQKLVKVQIQARRGCSVGSGRDGTGKGKSNVRALHSIAQQVRDRERNELKCFFRCHVGS